MRLGEAMNTYPIALYDIEKRGYSILYDYDKAEDVGQWIATKGDDKVFASCPLTLLALVVIADSYGENWQIIATRDLYDKILSSGD